MDEKKFDVKLKKGDKFKKFGGKIYSGFLWAVQAVIMGIIMFSTTLVLGVTLTQKLSIDIMKSTDFGGVNPGGIDIVLMVGLPTVFIMAFVFILMLLFYKFLWNCFTRTFNKLRNKYIDVEGESF